MHNTHEKRAFPSMVGQMLTPQQVQLERDKVVAVLATIQEIFELYGFDSESYSISKTVEHWTNLAGLVGWMKVAKYKIAAFFAFHIQNELPESPFPDQDSPNTLLGGKAGRWCRMFLNTSPAPQRISFLSSILYSKYGMPLPSESAVEADVLETVGFLTAEHPEMNTVSSWSDDWFAEPVFGSESQVSSPCPGVPAVTNPHRDWSDSGPHNRSGAFEAFPTRLSRQWVKEQVERTVDELFPMDRTWDEHLEEAFYAARFPSTKGNYNRGRAQGGAVGDVHELAVRLGENLSRSLLKGKWVPDADLDECISNDPFFGHTYVVDDSDLADSFRRLRELEREVAWIEPPLVEPVGLAEALKVRVISKGPPITYDYLKPLQQHMHKVLRNHPCFALVGETISAGYIHSRMGRDLPDGFFYQSGDYKASTNYLDPMVSEWIVDRVAARLRLPMEERLMFKRALTGHVFVGGSKGALSREQEDFIYNELVREERLHLAERSAMQDVVSLLPGVLGEHMLSFLGPRDQSVEGLKVILDSPEHWSLLKKRTWARISTSIPPGQRNQAQRFLLSMKKQRWGQLMGSIVSFPVLCIANAALCRSAIEYGEARKYTLSDARLCINGDDCLFRTNPLGAAAWRTLGRAFGLLPSLGKVYSSRFYLNMNSTSFRRREAAEGSVVLQVPDRLDPSLTRPAESYFEHVPFVNMRLLHGGKRSQAFGAEDKDLPPGARARDLLRSCPPFMRSALLKKFLNVNWTKLSTFRVPWFVPEWLGGLGLPTLVKVTKHVDEVVQQSIEVLDRSLFGLSPEKIDLLYSRRKIPVMDSDGNVGLEWTSFERSRAAALSPQLEVVKSASGFLLGPTDVDLRLAGGILREWSRKRPQRIPPAATWRIHELVKQQLPVQPVELLTPVDTKGYDQLYSKLVCSTFLLAASTDDLIDKSPADRSVKVLRANERLWRNAPHMHPVSLEKIAPRQVFTFLPVSLTRKERRGEH